MVIPTFSITLPNLRVDIFGRGVQFNPREKDVSGPLTVIEARARECGAKRVTWQRVPTRKYWSRRWEVFMTTHDSHPQETYAVMNKVHADGVVLTQAREAVAILTRDCPSVILASKREGRVAFMHAGRDALHGIDAGNIRRSVIQKTLSECMPHWEDPASVYGLIACGIEPEHFPNKRYPELISGLVEAWGPSILHDPLRGTLDLHELVLLQLESEGIPRKNIFPDGLGTFSDPRLASNRAGDTHIHNLIIATRTS